MSSNKGRVLALLLALGGLAGCAHAETACPSRSVPAGAALQGAEVFDGPPEELASLAPDDQDGQSWDLRAYQQGPRTLYLVCRYQDGSRQITPLPVATQRCNLSAADGVAASCR